MAQKKPGQKRPGGSWVFTLPSLPKECYAKVQSLCGELGLSQWQLFILAVAVLSQYDKAELRDFVNQVKETYKAPYAKPSDTASE